MRKSTQVTEEGILERFSVQATQKVGSIPSLILHTVFFVGIFSLAWFGFSTEQILLILTTAVSLEAIYLAIFIQMSVNRQAIGLLEVQKDIEDISEDVEEISEDIEDIQEDVEEMSEDIGGIHNEVKEISEEVEDISDEMEDDAQEEAIEKQAKEQTHLKLEKIESTLHLLLKDIEELRKK